jgi:thymidylate synthase (FAD)
MEVDLINGSENPEKLVCRCARGDYRENPVTSEYDFDDIISSVDIKDRWDDGDEIELKKKSLIDKLFRQRHMGVFEHPNATFAVEGISRVCMAQLTRHRHATFDVQSMRYVDFSGMDIKVGEDDYKEELEDYVVIPESIDDEESYSKTVVKQFNKYENMVDNGVPKEDARMVLPLGTKVNLTFSMNARSLMHLLDMRMKANAQWEIRELSDKLLEEAKDWMPTTFKLYEENHPNRLQA